MKLFTLFLGIILACSSCQKEVEEKKNSSFVENIVPVAEAGAVQSTIFPKDSVTLSGSGADQDGTVVAYLWSQVAGPAASQIRNPGSPVTVVKFSTTGNYKFQLMVVDNKGATGVDTTSVSVTRPAQTTVTLQPANNPNEKRLIYFGGTDASSTAADLPIEAWTNGGAPFNVRGIFSFDLSTIPQNAQIVSASLYLYSYPTPTLNGNLINANFGSSNGLILEQVTSPWTTAAVNWFNQPNVNLSNQILIPHTTQSTLDLNLDVKDMVASMVNNNANHGFLLRLQNEVTYNSRIFVSSFNTTYPDKRPKLVVTYQ
jgi:hypothetical protein